MSENRFYTFDNNVLNPTLECMQLEHMLKDYSPELIGKDLQWFFYKQLNELMEFVPDFLPGYVKLHELSLAIDFDKQDFHSSDKAVDALDYLNEVIGGDFSEKLDMDRGSNRTVAQILQICAEYDLLRDEFDAFVEANRLMAIDPSNQTVPAWAAYLAINRSNPELARNYAKGLKLSTVEHLMLSSCIDFVEDDDTLYVPTRTSALAGLIEAKLRCPSIIQMLEFGTAHVTELKGHGPGTGYGPQPNINDLFTSVYLMTDGNLSLRTSLQNVFKSQEVIEAETAFSQFAGKYKPLVCDTKLKELCIEAASALHERLKEVWESQNSAAMPERLT